MSEQPTLFEATPKARRTDPETSHEAAASVTDLRARQAAVLVALRHLGPSTDERLVEQYPRIFPAVPQSPSGLRTRRHELVAGGLVEWTGVKKVIASGRQARVWRAIQ